MIAHLRGRLAAKSADRVVIETAGGVGYEVVVPLGVMERLPSPGAEVTLATELVVREDGWALYGFLDDTERRFFQRLTSVTGVGPKAYRPTAVEQALVGKAASEDAVKAAVQTVADGIDVQGDIHASPEYRAHLARVLTRRAVLQAASRARS